MIIKKFDKKQLINALKALSDGYVYILFQDSREVIIKDSKTIINIQTK